MDELWMELWSGTASPAVNPAELSLLSTSHFTRITWKTPSHWFGQVLFTLLLIYSAKKKTGFQCINVSF